MSVSLATARRMKELKERFPEGMMVTVGSSPLTPDENGILDLEAVHVERANVIKVTEDHAPMVLVITPYGVGIAREKPEWLNTDVDLYCTSFINCPTQADVLEQRFGLIWPELKERSHVSFPTE